MESIDPATLLAETREHGQNVIRAVETIPKTDDRMEQLRAINSALSTAATCVAGLRDARDILIAEVAAEGQFGFARIGEAAGVAATYASRKAREAGVPPRHIREPRPGR